MVPKNSDLSREGKINSNAKQDGIIKSVNRLRLKKSLINILSMAFRKLSKVVKILVVTSGEQPESAPHLRLKKSKKTSKCQEFFSTVPEKPKSSTKLARPFGFFKHPLSCKISKNWSVEYQKTLKTLKTFRKQCLKMFHPNFENVTSERKFSVKKLNK